MTKTARNKLTDVAIKQAARPFEKALSDGGNLYLEQMPTTGLLKWRVTYRLRGKKATMWLGEYAPGGGAGKLGLKDARKRRDEVEDQASKGIDPKVARKVGPDGAAGMTFKQFVQAHGADLAPLAPKARKEWLSAMTGKVGKLADMQPGAITGDDIADVMTPIWLKQPATAKKRLSGIATILRAARARGVITTAHWQNPADYRNSFSGVMKRPVRNETPRTALPHADVPAFIADLRAQPVTALSLGLEWLVLTSVRSNEGLGAEWPEIDRAAKVWTITAERMKGQRGQQVEHRVPLSDAMLSVLDRAAAKFGTTGLIFPAPKRKAGRHDPNAAQDLLLKLRPGVTVHGFRSSFFDWATEATDHSDRLANAALAHVVANTVQRAYDRSDMLEKRRPLMADWGDHCTARCVVAANTQAPDLAAAA